MNFLEAVLNAWRVFRTLRTMGDHSLVYFAAERFGVPRTVLLIGTGREAWRAADLAIRHKASIE